MGTSIYRDGAAQANTPCSSSRGKARDASERTGEEIHSAHVGGELNTKQPQAESGS